MTRRGRSDTGSATVWVVIGMATVMFASGISASVGIVAAERHRASAAADAAAIAAALASLDGPVAACRHAAAMAAVDGAALVSCQLLGPVSNVAVSVGLPGPLRHFGTASAHARAGPAAGASSMIAPQ